VSDKQVRILLTHGHADHTHDADQIAASAIIIHELDRPLLLDPSKSFLTFFGKTRLLIEEGLIVTPEILHRPWKCLHTPDIQRVPAASCTEEIPFFWRYSLLEFGWKN
jgi:glyoxylase-like metal-dependent hydrolase (beta-lactamase superfamily II)